MSALQVQESRTGANKKEQIVEETERRSLTSKEPVY